MPTGQLPRSNDAPSTPPVGRRRGSRARRRPRRRDRLARRRRPHARPLPGDPHGVAHERAGLRRPTGPRPARRPTSCPCRAPRPCSPARSPCPRATRPSRTTTSTRCGSTAPWTENYGDATFGLPDGNIPLAIDKTTTLRFTYDHATHRVTGRPGRAGRRPDRRRPGDGGRQPAQGPHPRELLLRDGRPLRERHEGQRHGRHRRHAAARTASTRPARGSTTAVTSRGSSSASTTSRASAPRPSG